MSKAHRLHGHGFTEINADDSSRWPFINTPAKEYLEFAHKTEKRFIVMYGQTEATARMSYLPFDMGLKK